jgi:hypothetical protein
VDGPKVAPRSAAFELAGLLGSPEITDLIRELEATCWTGRPGYPIRAMVGMALAKSMYAIPTSTRTARLVAEHAALQAALGCEDSTPSEWACYCSPRSCACTSQCWTPASLLCWTGCAKRTPAWARASPSTDPTFPRTPTGSGSCSRTGVSVR